MSDSRHLRRKRFDKALVFQNGLVWGAAIVAMAVAIAERPWNCEACEGDTDGEKCEWCGSPRGVRCSSDDRSKADG